MKINPDDLKITINSPPKYHGGQHVGITQHPITVELPGFISITLNIKRSNLKNRDLAIALIELAMDD